MCLDNERWILSTKTLHFKHIIYISDTIIELDCNHGYPGMDILLSQYSEPCTFDIYAEHDIT